MSDEPEIPNVNSITQGQLIDTRRGDTKDDSLILVLDFGAFTANVPVSSVRARELAIEIITDQGPHLSYNPPNQRMQEGNVGTSLRSRPPRWSKARDVNDLVRKLKALRVDCGGEAFGYALQRLNEK